MKINALKKHTSFSMLIRNRLVIVITHSCIQFILQPYSSAEDLDCDEFFEARDDDKESPVDEYSPPDEALRENLEDFRHTLGKRESRIRASYTMFFFLKRRAYVLLPMVSF